MLYYAFKRGNGDIISLVSCKIISQKAGGSERKIEAGAMGVTQHSDESVVLSGTDERETVNGAKQLCTLLSVSIVGEMIEVVARGMKHLHLKGRETCSVTKDQKIKSICESWCTKANDRHRDHVSVDGSKFFE